VLNQDEWVKDLGFSPSKFRAGSSRKQEIEENMLE